MDKVTIGGIIKASIVTAFTIAAALIWKDVITGAIERFFPPKDYLLYQFIVASIATVIIVIVLYGILKAQKETEVVLRRLKNKKRGKNEI